MNKNPPPPPAMRPHPFTRRQVRFAAAFFAAAVFFAVAQPSGQPLFAASKSPTPPAAAPAPAPKPVLSAEIAEHIPAFTKLLDASDFPAILKLLDDTILPAAKPGSFDRALFLQIRGQALLNASRPLEAIPPLEESLTLASGKNWFDAATFAQIHQTLSQLFYQKFSTLPQPPPRASDGAPSTPPAILAAAIHHAKAALALTRRPEPDSYYYIATLHYTAATLDPEHPDRDKLTAALAAADESLNRRPAFHEPSLVLSAAIHQQLGHAQTVADTLELLLSRDPRNTQYWRQLFALYAGFAAEATLPSQIRHWQVLALHTQQRARAVPATGDNGTRAARPRQGDNAYKKAEVLPAAQPPTSSPPPPTGYLDSPQDYLNTVALLFALKQYDEAAGVLETSLASGQLPSTRQNWELVATAWQQHRAPDRAIAALQRAIARHPGDPELRLHLARLHLAQEAPALAREQTTAALNLAASPAAAVANGTNAAQKPAPLANPAEAWFLHAYIAYELHDYAAAASHLETARRQPNAEKLGASIRQLQAAIQAASPAKATP